MRKVHIIIIALIVIPVILLITYSGLKSNDAFSENLIISLSDKLDRELADLLDPVRDEILQIVQTYPASTAFFLDEDSLAEVFIPMVSSVPAIGSIMLYNSDGQSLTLYKEKNTFVTSLQIQGKDNTGLVWNRRLRDNSISSSWSEMISRQDQRRKALLDILNQIAHDDEEIWWPGLYQSNLLKEPVITAAVDWPSENNSSVFICSIEMPLRIMIRQLQSFNKYRDRIIFLETGSGQLIEIPAALPDTLQTLAEKYLTGAIDSPQDSILHVYLNNWQQQGGNRMMTYHHRLPDDDWWLHIRPFHSFERIGAIGLAVSEGSLKFGLLARNYQVIIVTVLALASTLMYIAAARRRKRKRMDEVNGTETTNWQELIKGGENQYMEFKSALRWDQHLQEVNPKLEDVIIKSIAAFNNGKGGNLLIGVRDNGEIAGLEGDFNSLKKNDSDYFEIHLRNLLKQHFGIPFITQHITMDFPVIDGKEICAIRIAEGTQPAYITTTDKHGNKTERFYVRSGNSSQEIQSLKEITDYISRRFPA
jgi:hypothetical protein